MLTSTPELSYLFDGFSRCRRFLELPAAQKVTEMAEEDEDGVSEVGEYRDPEGRLLVELHILLGGAGSSRCLRRLLLVGQHKRSIALCKEQTDREII